MLKTRVVTGERQTAAATLDLFLIATFEGEPPLTGTDTSLLPRTVAAAAKRAGSRAGWKGAAGQASTQAVGGKRPTTVQLRGLGKRGRWTRRHVPGWLDKALRQVGEDGFRKIVLVLPAHDVWGDTEGALMLLRELALTGYRFDELKKGGPRTSRPREARVVAAAEQTAGFVEAHRLAGPIARGVALTRDLGNTPPNIATPHWMAERARELADRFEMEIEVLGVDELADRGMGGITAVGGGSANPPCLVRLNWGHGDRSVSFVGKGVTFDTGGISIKPASSMDEMKFDKCGACAVLGITQALAELDLPFRFRTYVPLAENMPDGRAYRPSDIVTCYNGKTVEILNTDAEGRMILADALAWAAEEKPDYLVDYATLTGACVVALGMHGAGLFSHDDDLANALLGAAEGSGEYLWRLPLWPEFSEQMKGLHGDLQNTGARWGGANTAAAFLGNFVRGAKAWAHLDIAGPAYVGRSDKQGFGATGYGVGLTAVWLARLAGRLPARD